MYLFEKIDVIKEAGGVVDTILPSYIANNLNHNLTLRPYQKEAFSNFIYYYDSSNFVKKPCQTLFHMATGSGKTLIMAGLILFLYKKGYRNFLFFVNSSTIINKTKSNFLDQTSSKYLFHDEINIDGSRISIEEVMNFQDTDPNKINICFSTIQGLHFSMSAFKENSLTIDDFEKNKVVLISDEAHHMNALTYNGKVEKEEVELLKSWEYTVERILHANKENILLEFTATCDIDNSMINEKYKDKIIFNYPLSKYREDGYSKEVETLQSNVSLKMKMLQAVLLSQYRLKLFQDNQLDVKPVILFKSDTISNSKSNREAFLSFIKNLKEEEIYKIKEESNHPILNRMFSYFEERKVSIPNLILEIQEDFASSKCISVNNEDEAIDVQLVVNSLEDKSNLYRAIFEVKMLDEGWDVLNLFDIVRLYETRDGKNGKPGKKTIQEAQLIGRGARYYPFVLRDIEDKYIRKFDQDIENPLRICETLLYHCQLEPRYISELKVALRETGIIPEEAKKISYRFKESFKKSRFYQEGLIFYNERQLKDRSSVHAIPDSIRYETHYFLYSGGKTKFENLFEESVGSKSVEEKMNETILTISALAEINYNLVYTAFRKFNVFDFSILKEYFPDLSSTFEFITDRNYLGNIKVSIKCPYEIPTKEMFYSALVSTFNKIKDKILSFEEVYEGTTVFSSKKCNEVFKEKVVNQNLVSHDSIGISQRDVEDESYRLDLSDKDWYVYNDNYGTTEEKKFVKYFSENVSKLQEQFDEIYLIRNERELAIYSFLKGERFEPDYLLVLLKYTDSGPLQYQIFIEPKGEHLLIEEKWKENFLLDLKEKAIPVTKFVDDSSYLIWGFPFFNKENKMEEFENSMNQLL